MTRPLWRNRSFNLLWGSQTLSDLGASMSALAIPLLVLALTGSPVQAGAVGTVLAVTRLVCRLPAGVLADRVDRRRTLLACDAVRIVGYVFLGVTILTGHVSLTAVIAVAVLDAACAVLFGTVEHAALASLVGREQLPDAVARNEARLHGTALAGPPLGGLLFGLGRSLPFLADAVSYLLSFVGVLLIRDPMQQPRTQAPRGHATELAEGIRFALGDRFLRAVLLVAPPLNMGISGVVFALIVILQRHHVPPALIGTVETIIAAGGLVGAFAAPALQRRLRMPVLVVSICWAAVGLLALAAPLSSILAAVPVAAVLLLSPACNAALFGYQAAITPDRLQGRVVSVIIFAASSMASTSPLLAGLLIEHVGGPATLMVFAALVAVSALTATISRGIRSMRPLRPAVPAAEPVAG
ncbi:MFS transporter [Plantactinospora sp. KBS50]|uniref:MFS transporter n=1 Tax=Plantactinospora sp. KBS50 TaxID=2024580 RepID=UPI000BAB1A56|nr:MFS transporter [Plantactinospora sp. KBS50]ASW54083.1 MFS transporter [Plantactinospora sp. KBS50]